MKIFQAKIVNDEAPVRSPDPLKIGDLVKLKSGGPLMTVNKLAGEGDVWCLWFVHVEAGWRENTRVNGCVGIL